MKKKVILLVSYWAVISFSCFSLGVSDMPSQTYENDKQILMTSVSYLVDSGQLKEAIAVTEKFAKKYPSDGDSRRQLGLLQALAGKPTKAIQEFEKAYEAHDSTNEKNVDLYLMAKTYHQGKNGEKTLAVLKRMGETPEGSLFAEKAKAQLSTQRTLPEYDPKEYARPQVSTAEGINAAAVPSSGSVGETTDSIFAVSVVGGSDSNPIFIPDGSQTKNDAASTFVSTTLVGNMTAYQAGELKSSLSIANSEYQKEIAKSFNNFRWSLNLNWKPDYNWFKEQKISFNNSLDQSFQTQDGFQYFYTSDQLSLNKDFANLGTHEFSSSIKLGGRSYANKELTAPENNRSGYSLGLNGTHRTSLGELPWTNSLSITDQQTIGKKFNTLGLDLVSNLQQMLFGDFEILYGLSYGYVSYPNDSTKRVDRSSGIGLDISRNVNSVKGLNGKLSFARSQNRSTAAEFSYTQDIISLWVNYEFF